MGDNVQRAEHAQDTKNCEVLVVQIRQRHGVSPCSVSYTPLLLHAILPVGIQQLGIQTTLQGENRCAGGIQQGDTFRKQPRISGAQDFATGNIRGDCSWRGERRGIGEGKYLATAFLLSSDRRRYVELILLLNNDYTKQQRKYLRTLTDIYRLVVAFDPTRATPVDGRAK